MTTQGGACFKNAISTAKHSFTKQRREQEEQRYSVLTEKISIGYKSKVNIYFIVFVSLHKKQ